MWLREEDGRVRLRPQPSEAPSSPATLLPFPWAGRPQTGTGDAVLAGQVPCPGAHPGCVALRGAAPGTSCARSTGWGPGPRPIAHQNSAGIDPGFLQLSWPVAPQPHSERAPGKAGHQSVSRPQVKGCGALSGSRPEVKVQRTMISPKVNSRKRKTRQEGFAHTLGYLRRG